jgi:acetyltransferase-like isoleucine patch superfamily enzyme
MSPSKDSLVRLGEDCNIEAGAVLGRLPDREAEVTALELGDGAHVRSGTVIYACSTIGRGLETGHNVVIREENSFGDGVSVWSGSCIDYGCTVGSRVKVHCLCYVAQFTVIEDDVFIGPGVTLTNDFHPGCDEFRECMRGPRIGEGAVIGAHATILPRVDIGKKAFVAAGSVVTADVPPETVVAGNPARTMGSVYDMKCKTGLTEFPYQR